MYKIILRLIPTITETSDFDADMLQTTLTQDWLPI